MGGMTYEDPLHYANMVERIAEEHGLCQLNYGTRVLRNRSEYIDLPRGLTEDQVRTRVREFANAG